MIKQLKQYQVQTTPFQATKDWTLSNTDNFDLLLFESTGPDDGLPIDLEYVEYNVTSPVSNFECKIALEKQEEDVAVYREGLKLTGIFYPELDPVNADGTYKRMVHAQTKTMFYNEFRDPTKVWGIENLDFEISKTKRLLSDSIKIFEIPRLVFGDKIIPSSITIYNTTQDNNYNIIDDGNGNLFAQKNLFTKQQEIGNFQNYFDIGNSSLCSDYFNNITSSTTLFWKDDEHLFGFDTNVWNSSSISVTWAGDSDAFGVDSDSWN